MKDILHIAKEILNYGFHIPTGKGTIHLTIGLLLILVLALVVTNYLLKGFKRLFTRNLDKNNALKFTSIYKFVRYIIFLVVVLITLGAAGVDLTVLVTASAAFFVGIGLALQEIFQDIISGFLIITDKSLVVGDIIEADGKVGKVIEVKLRTTRVMTRDDKVVIVPNHIFINKPLYNYTQNGRLTGSK